MRGKPTVLQLTYEVVLHKVKKEKYTIKPCITTNSKNLNVSLSHPKFLYFFERNDCDINDFFYSHANETYYHKKDLILLLALLGK